MLYLLANSEYKDNIVSYMAGYVQKSIVAKESCDVCKDILVSQDRVSSNILDIKNRGGLTKPCEDLVRVVKVCDSIVEKAIKEKEISRKKENFVLHTVVKTRFAVLEICPNLFMGLEMTSPTHDHKCNLIDKISSLYTTIRINHLFKKQETGFRRMSNKVVLFRHK